LDVNSGSLEYEWVISSILGVATTLTVCEAGHWLAVGTTA